MKNLILGFVALAFIGCANMPNVAFTDSSGNSVALGSTIVSYVDQDGKQITCEKEADVWNCTYKDENGNVLVLDNLNVDFLEKRSNEQGN